MVMSMNKSRKMRRSRGMSMSKSRKMRRQMRGGRLTSDSSYSTLVANSGSQSTYLNDGASANQQNFDRNSSSPSGEGPQPSLSGYQQPPPFSGSRDSIMFRDPMTGGRRRRAAASRRRGGGIIGTAAVPFGLWGLQRLMAGRSNGSRPMKTRRHRRRM